MNASDFLENAFLDHIFRVAAYAQPTSLQVALFDSTSSDALLEAGTLTGELVGNGYSRVTISTEFNNASAAGIITNSGDIIFPQATGNWPDVVRSCILDESSNVLIWGTLTPVSVSNGDTFQFNVSNWTTSAD